MRVHPPRPIVLLGPMGSGKSTLAPLLARQFRCDWIDLDTFIEDERGSSIETLFREQGEASFRALEAKALEACLLREGRSATECRVTRVLATGGGAVCTDRAWAQLRGSGAVTVYLNANAERCAARCVSEQRPMIAGLSSARARTEALEALHHARLVWYQRADLELQTDTESPEQLATRLGALVEEQLQGSVPVRLADKPYQLQILDRGPARVAAGVARRFPPSEDSRHLGLIADTQVFALHGEPLVKALEEVGYVVSVHPIPAGEAAKTWSVLGTTLDGLLESGLQREDLIIGLGGGAATDLAGLAASLLYRGVSLAQLPTSLLGMIDASVGGKTAVDHGSGKNLIGSFYQPGLVVANLETLKTLPKRELVSGLGEVIKVGLLEGETGLRWLETLPSDPHNLPLRELVLRCAGLKAKVVEQDTEERGLRRVLNLGHTLGHAIEHQSAGALLHGEAVGLGLLASARVGEQVLEDPWDQLEGRVYNLMQAWGLPTKLDAWLRPSVLDLIERDKKATATGIRWVLATADGPRVVSLTSRDSRGILESIRR